MARKDEGGVLYELVQRTYFNNIDAGDARAAVKALHPDVEWQHRQVWEHDGHSSDTTDVLHGRQSVQQFLADRIDEMQTVGIEHEVSETLSDGARGAFRAEVVGPTGATRAFLGWVELADGLIRTYTVAPT